MDINAVMKMTGSPGRFAWILTGLAYINFFVVVFNDLFPGIYGATPEHHCRLPAGVSANTSIPVDHQGSLDSCHVWVNYSQETGETQRCPQGWVYLTEEGETTIPTEWDLVCDKKYLNSLSTSLYYVGIVIGSLLFGTLSDRIGRRPVIILCLFSPLFLGVLIYFVESFVVFVALRFLTGMMKQGLQINSFVLAMEFFTSNKHFGLVAALLETPFPMVGILLAVISWALKDWRLIQLAIISPCVLGFSYFWIIPESLRWQISTRRYKEASENMRYVAKMNGVDLQARMKGAEDLESLLAQENTEKQDTSAEKKYSLLDLFRYSKIRRWTIFLIFIWLANSCTSYGIILNSHKLPGNRFVSMGVATAVELPAILLVAIFSRRLRRKWSLCASNILTGVFCLAYAFTPASAANGWLSIVFISIAKFSTSLTWTLVGVISCEIYPTVMRTIGYGVCVFAAKFGSILAPQILFLGDHVADWLPMFILGIATLMMAGLSLLLPETRGLLLPNTVEEAEARTCPIDIIKKRIKS